MLSLSNVKEGKNMTFVCGECSQESIWLTNNKLHIEGEKVCDACWSKEFGEPEVIIRTTSYA